MEVSQFSQSTKYHGYIIKAVVLVAQHGWWLLANQVAWLAGSTALVSLRCLSEVSLSR